MQRHESLLSINRWCRGISSAASKLLKVLRSFRAIGPSHRILQHFIPISALNGLDLRTAADDNKWCEHDQDTATDRDDDDPQVGLLRTQEMIVRPAWLGLETETHEALPTQDGLKQDLSTAPATGLMNPITEGTAPRMPSEGRTAAEQEQDVPSPVRDWGTAQKAVREASTVPSIPAGLLEVDLRPTLAFILQAERQAAAEYRPKVESSRLRREGGWGA
jgi:hypothetical protein